MQRRWTYYYRLCLIYLLLLAISGSATEDGNATETTSKSTPQTADESRWEPELPMPNKTSLEGGENDDTSGTERNGNDDTSAQVETSKNYTDRDKKNGSVGDGGVNSDSLLPCQLENLPGRSTVGDKGIKGTDDEFDRCAVLPPACNPGEKCEMVNGRVNCYTPVCTEKSCSGKGTCIEARGGYRCVCLPGFEGKDCEKKVAVPSSGACEPNPCKGDCTCRESCQHEGGYFCASRGGFIGKHCTIPIPRVLCGERNILIDIPEELYVESDKAMGNTYFYASPNPGRKILDMCEAKKVDGSYQISIPLPFSACDSRPVRSGSSTVIRNRLFIDRKSDQFSMAIPIVDFECRYERQYQLVTSLKPVVSQPEVISDDSGFEPKVELCKVQSCASSCPENFKVTEGAMYTVGEIIHLTATALPTGGFLGHVTTIESVALTCEVSSKPSTIVLIDKGCHVNDGLYVSSTSGEMACIDFQVPRGIECENVFILLNMVICDPQHLKPCSNGRMHKCVNARKRRSVASTAPEYSIKLGPLTLIRGAEGNGSAELYPGAMVGKSLVFENGQLTGSGDDGVKSRVDTSVSDDLDVEKTTILATLIPGVCLVLFVLLLLLAWYRMSSGLRSALVESRFRRLLSSTSSFPDLGYDRNSITIQQIPQPPAYFLAVDDGCNCGCGMDGCSCRCSGHCNGYSSFGHTALCEYGDKDSACKCDGRLSSTDGSLSSSAPNCGCGKKDCKCPPLGIEATVTSGLPMGCGCGEEGCKCKVLDMCASNDQSCDCECECPHKI